MGKLIETNKFILSKDKLGKLSPKFYEEHNKLKSVVFLQDVDAIKIRKEIKIINNINDIEILKSISINMQKELSESNRNLFIGIVALRMYQLENYDKDMPPL